MITITKTDSSNKDFLELIQLLDENLSENNGDEQEFFNQFNKVNTIKHVIIAYENNIALGCGAIKEYSSDSAEVKRMFVRKNMRGKGLASLILKELEVWAKDLGYSKLILETGIKQSEAIALYKKNDFIITNNYGQYKGISSSVCFEKTIKN